MNDSISVTYDTIMVKMDKIAFYLQPVQQTKATNWMDVIIALIVCGALAFIAWIIFKKITDWKQDMLKEEKEKRNAEIIKEEKDKKFKLRNDYQAKLLDHLKKDIEDCEKNKDSAAANTAKADYVACLNKYIDELKK